MANKDLVLKWRQLANVLAKRAQELGNCSAGLQLFTEATTLRRCADELEAVQS
jgi:hypothetical protein